MRNFAWKTTLLILLISGSLALILVFYSSFSGDQPSENEEKTRLQLQKALQKNVDSIIPDDISKLPTDEEGNRIIDIKRLNPENLEEIQKAHKPLRQKIPKSE